MLLTKEQLWQAILGEMELTVSKANFTTWFGQTYVYSFCNDELIVSVPNTFTKAWFEKKFHTQLSKIVSSITEKNSIKIFYKIKPKENEKTNPYEIASVAKPEQVSRNSLVINLNKNYTFESFIVGKENELAYTAAKAASESPGQIYNPLFIYGNVGLGKTHLMQAMGNFVLKNYNTKKILFVSCERFVNDFLGAIQSKTTPQFRDKYRNVDMLLMDDVQFFTNKESTQEAFFHAFNELHQSEKQIVLTSDRPPKLIPALQDRLISRFEWGMIADVVSPGAETRKAILASKAEQRGLQLNDNVLEYLAQNILNNVRELEGALNKLIAYNKIRNIEITYEVAREILDELKKMPKKGIVNIQTLIKIISEFYNVSSVDLIGNSRKRDLVTPRQIAMYLMRSEFKASYPVIGSEMGGRDHTTAIHACNKIERKIQEDEELRQDLDLVRQKMYTEA